MVRSKDSRIRVIQGVSSLVRENVPETSLVVDEGIFGKGELSIVVFFRGKASNEVKKV
jgi:hypothetical protein